MDSIACDMVSMGFGMLSFPNTGTAFQLILSSTFIVSFTFIMSGSNHFQLNKFRHKSDYCYRTQSIR